MNEKNNVNCVAIYNSCKQILYPKNQDLPNYFNKYASNLNNPGFADKYVKLILSTFSSKI